MKKLVLLAVATLVVVLGVSVASASAATGLIRVGAFAEQGPSPSGDCYGHPAVCAHHQGRIAVNYDTGDVYVADRLLNRVSVYRQNGTGADLLTSFGSGVLIDPYGLAIDQDTGTVYVSDADGITKYDSDNAATPAFTVDGAFAPITATGPLAFDQAANELLLADTSANIVRRYSAAGAPRSTFDGTGSPDTFGTGSTFTQLQDLAVDTTGDVIVIDATDDPGIGGTSRIERFDAGGTWEATIGPVDQAATVGIYPNNNDVIIGGAQNSIELGGYPTVDRFAANGTDLGAVAVDPSLLLATTSGIAADDGVTGRLHVATDVSAGHDTGNRPGAGGLTSVQNYDVLQLPTVNPAPATDLAPFSATLHGTVNPEGSGTTYHFEVSADGGSSWSRVDQDGDGDESAGNGTTAVNVDESATGLAENTNYLFRLVAKRGVAPATSGTAAFTTTDAPDPDATAAATSDITSSSATLNGSVNPQGGPGTTSYHFEYSGDGGNLWQKTTEQSAGGGTTAVSVSATITNQPPATAYQVRLVATKGSIRVTSAETQFTSLLAPPPTTATPVAVTGASATLRGTITTYGAAAGYHFEYGTTTGYGTSVPVTDATVDAGQGDVTVEQKISGLTAGTTYHYRLVATNAAGTTVGDDHTFQTVGPATGDTCPNAAVRAQQHAENLVGCRAYERVSEAEKAGQAVSYSSDKGGISLTAASRDGDGLVYASWGTFADSTTGLPSSYLARRGVDGSWGSRSVTPTPVSSYHDAALNVTASTWTRASWDLSAGYTITADNLDPTDTNGTWDLYRITDPRKPELVTRGNGGERTGPGDLSDARVLPGFSSDGRHTVFATNAHLVPEDAGRTDGDITGAEVYDRFDGHTYLLNQAEGGGLINKCGSALPFDGKRRMISEDGSRIMFVTPNPPSVRTTEPDCAVPAQLYMRVNHAHTIHISASQRTTPDAEQAATYVGASLDGNLVFFSSGERLTDDVTSGGLYRYTVSTGKLDLIIADSDAPTAPVVKISGDGSHVYFMSPYVLAPGGEYGPYNLYDWSHGAVHLVTVSPDSSFATDIATSSETLRPVVVTPDGEHMLFSTGSPLKGFDNHGHKQAYLYSASDSKLVCVSCDPAGQRPAGSEYVSDVGLAQDNDDDRTPVMTADGSTVVFETKDRLVADDTDGGRDIYEYTDGRLHLVTDGHNSSPVSLVGMAADGRDVFFGTAEGLVADDTDGDTDIYDARRGGGTLAVPTPEGSACDGDTCQGGASAATPAPAAASVLFSGAGDGAPPLGPVGSAKPRVSKASTVFGTSTTLKVKVASKGTIRISGPGLTATSKKASKAGTYAVAVRLSAKARKELARKKKLTVTVSVGFTPSAGRAQAVRVRVTFKPKKQSARRSARAAGTLSHDARKGQ